MILFIWNNLFENQPIYVFAPLEWIVTQFIISLLASIVVLYPYISYELYLFAKPGLYEGERRFVRNLLIPSYIIFIFGILISFKLVVPFLYKVAYVATADPYLSAKKTLQNAIKVFFAFGVFLQIPLATLIAARLRLVDYKTMKNFRLPVYVMVFILVTNVSMDFTGITQIAILSLFVCMYELSLALLKINMKLRKNQKDI
jgi:sec-independent protein translocase protein TatC